MTYCAVSDLQKYYSPIDNYDLKMALPDFEFVNYSGDKWSLGNSGNVAVIYLNGTDLGAAQASESAIDAENKWFYDSDADKFYIQLGTGDSPEDDDIRLERSPQDWGDAKTEAVQIGTNKVNARLDKRFPVPLPKTQGNETGDAYDQPIVELCALFAILHLIQSSGSEDWVAIENRITNENENGILDLLNKGEIKLSFELTKSDDGQIKEISTNASTTGYPTDPIGEPSVAYDVYTITIGTGGTFTTGTANSTITYSTKNLNGDTVQGEQLIDGGFQAVGGGMFVRFESSPAGLVYTANDKWSLSVQTDGINTTVIGVIRETRR